MGLVWDLECAVVGDVVEVLVQEVRCHLNYFHLLYSLGLILQLQRHAENEMLDYGDKWITGEAGDMVPRVMHMNPWRQSPIQDLDEMILDRLSTYELDCHFHPSFLNPP